MIFPKENYCIVMLLMIFLNLKVSANEISDIKYDLPRNKNNNTLIYCAEHGSSECKKKLGIFYAYKLKLSDGSFSKDDNLAERWLQEVSFYPSARFILGALYVDSDKLKHKEKTAEALLRSSCTEDDINACYYLYKAYGGIVKTSFSCKEYWCDNALWAINKALDIAKKNIDEEVSDKYSDVDSYSSDMARILIMRKDSSVISILEEAVSRDAPFASMHLAPLYAEGKLTPKNLIRAYMMYDLTGTGYADEKAKVAAQMTPEQVHEAQEMSWRWQDEHRSYRAGYRGSDMGIQWKLEQH